MWAKYKLKIIQVFEQDFDTGPIYKPGPQKSVKIQDTVDIIAKTIFCKYSNDQKAADTVNLRLVGVPEGLQPLGSWPLYPARNPVSVPVMLKFRNKFNISKYFQSDFSIVTKDFRRIKLFHGWCIKRVIEIYVHIMKLDNF